MTFYETVQYLYDLQKFGTKLGLDNTRELLRLLCRPDEGRKYLHVTGTNGKGSVCAMAASVLSKAGHRTGLYTSPHLVSFTERIKVDGVEVARDEVVALAGRLRALVSQGSPSLMPTFFEFTTAMAFDHFARADAEAVVLEVGMGGRLDSTNVVEPLCTVITNVEMEHAEYLGNTIEKVAYEKAGIIKPGVPLVSAEAKPGVLSYLDGLCRELGSPMYVLGRDFSASPLERGADRNGFYRTFDYDGPGGPLKGLKIPLAGSHQVHNAAVALCALGLMSGNGLPVNGDSISAGLGSVSWEGRLEVASTRPFVVLDGAHNPASARKLADTVKDDFSGLYDRLILVMGVLDDKDFSSMFGLLGPLAQEVIFTSAEYERAVPPDKLLAAAGAMSGISFTDTVAEGLEKAFSAAGPRDMVLVAGSLYVVGEAKALLAGKEPFLKA